MLTIHQLTDVSTQIRRDILRMVHGVSSGHPGGSLGCADFFVAMYFRMMRPDPALFTMEGDGEDIFVLSNGHISPVWYSTLARYGYFPLEELGTFRHLGSRLQGHPSTDKGLPGIRVASGSLGQGLSVAIGMAEGKRQRDDKRKIFCLMGDGELQEGQIWEAAMYASARGIDNLIATIDYNRQQIDGATNDVLPMGDLRKKWEAFDWTVLECNGNKMEELVETLEMSVELSGHGKPVCILMHTEMGFGVDFMTGSHKWHGVAPNDEQLATALTQLPETLGDF